MSDTIRCLCAKCQAFTEHTIPGGKCLVCDAPIPTGEDIGRMGDVPRETKLDADLAAKLADLSERYCTPEEEKLLDEIEPVPMPPGSVEKILARVKLEEQQRALHLVLAFHRGGAWTDEDRALWREITGGDEATTKSMCDHIRKVLDLQD